MTEVTVSTIESTVTVTDETGTTTVSVTEESVGVVSVGIQGPEGASGMQSASGTAGETLSALRVVRTDPATGKFRYADKDTVTHAGTVVGVTTASAALDAAILVHLMGFLTDNSWAWNTAGDLGLYLGSNGGIVQGAPTGAFTQRVGFVVSATKIFVKIDLPIVN